MRVQALSPAERARFRLTHDLKDRESYAVDLIATVCRVDVVDAQRFWDNTSVGEAYTLLTQCEAVLTRDTISEYVDVLHEDAFLSSIMRVCEHYRIGFSDFALWSDVDQNLALAYFLESRDTCPGCGLPKRLRKQLIHLSSEQCIHCQELKEAQDSIPDEIRGHTHIVIKPSEP